MPTGLRARDIVIAFALVIIGSIVGFAIGKPLGWTWLTYLGSFLAVGYLVTKYARSAGDSDG